MNLKLRLPLAIIALLAAVAVTGRTKLKVEKPDLDKIRTEVLDPSSKYYYPRLEETYNRNDTVMTPEEYRYFYLGYMFQEDYDPYRESMFSSRTDRLREKVGKYTPHELDTIITNSELALQDNPFDLRQMSFLVHALKEKGKTYRAKFWEYRLENLLGAIKSTGTGESADDAWYVIYPMHEYDMVQLLGYDAVDAEYPRPGIDYLSVTPDEETGRRLRDKAVKGFYFNVEIPQEQYELKHPEEFREEESSSETSESDTVSAL